MQFFLQNDHLYGSLMDHKKIFCYFISKKGPNSAYLEGIYNTYKTRQMPKIQWVQHITVSNTLLYPKYTVSTLAFNIHLFNFPLLDKLRSYYASLCMALFF